MNIQEQAYINGFVKRAAEYGFNENEAVELLKEAARGASAARLALGFGKDSKRLGEYAISAKHLNAPGKGTPDSRRLAELSRQLKAHEKAKKPMSLRKIDRQNEALRIMR